VNTIYGIYTSDKNTRQTKRGRGRKLAEIVGDPNFFALAEKKLNERSERAAECVLWTGAKFRGGYGAITIGGATYSAHRLSWAIHNRSVPGEGMQVMHSCDVRHCINPAHLSLGTAADNLADAKRKGRTGRAKGSNSARAKWSEQQVLQAAHMRAEGFSWERIGCEFGVHASTVWSALSGRQWPHLRGEIAAIIGR
jgi:hypothetical protein